MNSITTGVLSLLALALVGSGCAATGGQAWRGARWEMTPNEVLAAFPGEASPDDAKYSRDPAAVRPASGGSSIAESVWMWKGHSRMLVAIPRYPVGGLVFRVSFAFNCNDELALVQMMPDPTGDQDFLLDVSGYEDLVRLLTDRYGSPFDRTRDDLDHRVSWKSGATIIDASFIELTEHLRRKLGPPPGPVLTKGTGLVFLNYRPTRELSGRCK